jgi:RHS repeat-associated protein
MSSTYTFTGVPSVLHFPGGYCTFEGSSLDAVPHYFTTDYQGNVRIVSAQDGTVEQVTNYYPFGAPYSDGTSTSVSLQPHNFSIERVKRKQACSSEREKNRPKVKYNGKELDMTHGWNTYDYGARIYDPILCQWTSPDPLTGEYPWMSPYVYCGNDPINAVDSDGRSIYMLFYTT